MMKYLTGSNNSKQHPNQNYARELCELFTLGRVDLVTGTTNYTEKDVQEIARALTGYTYDWSTSTIKFNAAYFDSGNKTFLGAPRGNAGVAQVIDAITQQHSWGTHVPARLYRELVGLEPSTATLEVLRPSWTASGDVRAVVTAICNLPDFLDDTAIGSKVKTPIDLLVSAGRVLNIDMTKTDFGWQLRDILGMHPMFPPNVGGWPAGTRWLNAGGLMCWNGFAQVLAMSARNTPGSPVAQLAAVPPAQAATEAARLACITDLTASTTNALNTFAAGAKWGLDRAAGTFALLLVSPEFAAN
jgi:uncharacterized protein (DUF1800 family)